MRLWGTRRKQATYSRLLAEAAGNEAVRVAEELVGAVWLATLAEAQEQAEFATKVCTHMRDTAHQVLRTAEATRDAGQIEAGRHELRESQEALARIRERRDGVLRFVGRQRTAWATAAKSRTLEALADRERLIAAARAAGVAVDPLVAMVDETETSDR
jgi:hypothetical protein